MTTSSFWAILTKYIKIIQSRMQRDRIRETASSLTYQTVLALVPLFAVLFGIAKGFSLDTMLEEVLREKFADHQEVIQHLLTFSQKALEQMKSGLIAGLGIIFLLITTTNLLFTTENVMNRMWGVFKGRSLARRIADFQSCLFLFPILLVIGSSTTLFIQTILYGWKEALPISVVIQPFILSIARLLPLATVWIVFALCYWLIPYVPIKKRYALSTAAVVTLIFHFLQSWYIYLQLKLTKISVIYGSFAALPLFLVWLWISWFIFLLGAELMVLLHEKGLKKEIMSWSNSEGEYFSLMMTLMQQIVNQYKQGHVSTMSTYADILHVPMYSLSKSIALLKSRQLIYTFTGEQKNICLVPTQKALNNDPKDLLFPPFDSLTPSTRETIERWESKSH